MTRKKLGIISLLLIQFFLLSSCNLQRTAEIAGTDSSVESQTGEIISVELPDADLDGITQTFLGLSAEESLGKGGEITDGNYWYEKHGKHAEDLAVARDTNGEGVMVGYHDFYENAGDQYELIYSHEHMDNVLDYGMRARFPKEDLDSCSKEEVLGKCKKYAEVLGYGGAEASVYAMTLDALQKAGSEIPGSGAPIPGFDRTKQSELSLDDFSRPWKKEYEALLVIYRPYVNGIILDSASQTLVLIYVPKYEKVVMADGMMAWKVAGTASKEVLIPSSEAISKVMLKNGIQDKADIDIKEPQLVYSANLTQLNKDHTLCLCWRVDYELKNSAEYKEDKAFQTMLVNAVTGEECQMYDVNIGN